MSGKAGEIAIEGSASAASVERLQFGALPTTLGYKLRRVQLAYKRHFTFSAPDSDFQLHDVGVLSLIARNPDVTPSALAASLTIDAAQITNILKLLDAKGLISRRKSPSDSRSRVLRLTALGQREHERLNAIIQEVEQSFIGDALSPEEISQLLGLLERLEVVARSRD